MTFTQHNARLKNFLNGWLLVLGLKESLVECATVCVKSEVILIPSMKTTYLTYFDRNINGNRDVKFLIAIIGHCTDQRKLL